MPLPGLTLTEERVVSLLASGLTSAEVAATLDVSFATVEWHLCRARRKLDRLAALRERIGSELSEPDGRRARRR